MAGSGPTVPMKRSLSEKAQDDLSPPTKINPTQVRLKGRIWTKHPRYYFEDGSITLLISDTAYRVQGSVLIHWSPYWRGLLGSERKETYEPQELLDVRIDEMDMFLSLLYPSFFDRHEITTAEGWHSILRLSNLWRIPALHSLAFHELDAVATPLYKLMLARKGYNVPAWVDSSIDALAHRPESLSLEEANMLRLEDVLSIHSARERLHNVQPETHPAANPAAPTVNAARQALTSATSSVALNPKPHLPEITVPFTRKELQELSTILSGGDLEKLLGIVTMDKVPAFCHVLADFSNLLSPSSSAHVTFCGELFKAISARPTHIPVAVKIVSFIVLLNEYNEPRLSNGSRVRLTGFRSRLQDDADRLRGLWAAVAEAKSKYKDFGLAWKSGTRDHYTTPGLLGLASFGDPPEEAVYDERSKNVEAFLAALEADSARLIK